MSLRAILETLLHVESFRNIDLFNQGLYTLRFTLSYSQHNFTFVSAPLDTDSLRNLRRSKRVTDPHNVWPSSTNDYTSAYTVRTFLIRYVDEDVKLNDFCVFRLEVDVEPGYAETPLFLKVELLFADLVSSIANELLDSSESFPEYPMNVVATSEVQINYPLHGVQEYIPVTFNETYYCVVNTTLVSTLVGFQMRMSPLAPPGQEVKRSREHVDLGMMWYQALFANSTPDTILAPEQVEKVFKEHVGFIGMHYKQLRAFINEVYFTCLNDKRRETFDSQRMPGPLFPLIEGGPSGGNETEDITKVLEGRLALLESFKTAYELASKMIEETSLMSAHVCQLLHSLRELLKTSPKSIRQYLQLRYNQRVKERWGESIFRELTSVAEFPYYTEVDIGTQHSAVAASRRSNTYYRRLTPMAVEQVGVIPKADQHPILFEEAYEKSQLTERATDDGPPQPCGVHMFVLVHGFQGNSFDMRLFRSNIALMYPDSVFLSSTANEGSTDGHIGEMGKNLATELLTFIEEACPLSSIGRVSFIGHSLGGLIIRAALPRLEVLNSRLHAFITLSSPHLGYMNGSSRLVSMGLWVLKKWRKSVCLKQLSLTDSPHPAQTFLFELSQNQGLAWFKHVVLLSSAQDSYAPFDSARIEVSSSAAQDAESGGTYLQMAGSLISSLKSEHLHRLDVNFKINEKNIDTMIGRKAHIMFLENEALMRMLVHCYPQLFS
jgi:pimeloyl-ACP methyl ester carboxylesterase